MLSYEYFLSHDPVILLYLHQYNWSSDVLYDLLPFYVPVMGQERGRECFRLIVILSFCNYVTFIFYLFDLQVFLWYEFSLLFFASIMFYNLLHSVQFVYSLAVKYSFPSNCKSVLLPISQIIRMICFIQMILWCFVWLVDFFLNV